MKIATAYYIESPLFEIVTEDGIGEAYNLQIVAEEEDGNRRTHFQTFESWDRVSAQNFVDTIVERGEIDPQYWNEGTSWDHYAVPQTYDEEKLEAEWKGI